MSTANQLAADLPKLTASADQLDQQPIDVTEYQPTHFWFTESTYRKYLPDDRKTLIGGVDLGATGISSAGFYSSSTLLVKPKSQLRFDYDTSTIR